MSRPVNTSLYLLRLLIEILGEKKVFTKKEYAKIRSNMNDESEFEDTIQVLEHILANLKVKK